MKTTDSGKLIEHIEEAKGWLDKAKAQVETNPVHGELILNLAQAEVKCAWELTHQQNVSNNIKKMPSRKSHKWNYYIPAAAASIIIISGLVFSLHFGRITKPEKTGIAKAFPGQTIEKKGNIQSNDKIAEKLTDTQLVSESKKEPDLLRKQQLFTKPNFKKVVPKVLVAEEEVVVESSPAVSNPVPVSTSGNQNELAVIPNKEPEKERVEETPSKVKPVSQISIDVDALTQEASQSLRKGK